MGRIGFMNSFRTWHLSVGRLLIWVLLVAVASRGTAKAEALELTAGDVVAFVGGESLIRVQERGHFEAAMTAKFREARPKFRDLAWEGDTVYFQSTVRVRWRDEAFGGWDEQLKRAGATVVVAQFGTMESLDGVGELGRFEEAYGELVERLGGEGRRVVLVAPEAPRWNVGEEGVLEAYSKAAERVAEAKGCGFVRELAGGEVPEVMLATVREKHRVWRNYWMPDNWKCLFGDDKRRVFAIGSEDLPTFQEEWGTYPALIEEIEAAIFAGRVWVPRVASPLTGSGEADVEKELADFEVLDGFEVSLFADESHGIANPLAVRWDARGRMYVACSDDYPQAEPGTVPDDKVILLEDRDGDGRADRSEVFAGGLSIPAGMEVGASEVFVGHGTELLRLRDGDGDGVADEREVLLRGFGNGDSHQTANSFVWGPSGDLWFCQGDGIESRVETPGGVSSLFQAGVFRLRPDGLVLDGLLDDFMGPGNPWGVVFDDAGQSLVVDGAGGISFLTPASIPAKRRLRLPRIGKPGGYCGVECIGAGNWPEATNGQFLLGDYKKNQVSRFRLEDDGAGFKVEFEAPLLRSAQRNFRPIDVKTGPDGAVYVVDWYNPITCHQDDFYRHPERDKTHGRIWRVVPKGKALPVVDLVGAGTRELLSMLGAEERWTRLKVKQVLRERGVDASEVMAWVEARGEKLTERELFGLVGLGGSGLVERLMGSEDFRLRAYAARVAGREGDFGLLQRAASDGHPRVRMEAVLAAGQIPEARSVLIAAAVAESPMDRWVEYGFSQAVEHLKRYWVPALREGELDFGGRGRGFAVVLEKAGSGDLIGEVREMVGDGENGTGQRMRLAKSLAVLGGDEDVEMILKAELLDAGVVEALGEKGRPGIDLEDVLGRLMDKGERGAVVLAGKWGVEELRDEVLGLVDGEFRAEAIGALGDLGGDGVVRVLEGIAVNEGDGLWGEALEALLKVDLGRGVSVAAGMLAGDEVVAARVLTAVVGREGGGRLLAEALSGEVAGERLKEVWVASGLVDGALEEVFGLAGEGEFDEGLLRELVAAGKAGDALLGKVVFESGRAGCAGCHRVGEAGGVIGPDLSAVGSGILPERIVTEVMWPARQVKEGYSLSQLTLQGGRVVQGYEQGSRGEAVLLRDFVSGELEEIASSQVVSHERVGSLMPATAQGLSREELGDLLAYLFGLRGSGDR